MISRNNIRDTIKCKLSRFWQVKGVYGDRRGLPHPEQYLLCDQESVFDRLLVACVFAGQFWYLLWLRQVGLHYSLATQPSDVSFFSWWARKNETTGLILQGLNSLIFLS